MKFKLLNKISSLVIALLLFIQLIPINATAVGIYSDLTKATMGKYILSPVKTYDMGRAGSITFNKYNQEMFIQHDELSLTGGDIYVDVDRYYNSYFTYHDTGDIYGNGWHINYSEKLFYNDDTNHFIYFRDDGSCVEFEKSELQENGFDKWVEVLDKQGAKLDTLWLPANSLNLSEASVKTIVGKILKFDSLGRLIEISYEGIDSCVTISYIEKTDKINIIQDPNGRQYCFEYEDNLLSTILCKDKNGNNILISDGTGNKVILRMKYLYDTQGNLINVIYPDGEMVSYGYNKAGELNKITNIDGVTLEIEYNGQLVKQIKEVSESNPNLIKSKISIKRTSVNNATITEDNLTSTQSFDKYGYPIYTDTKTIEPLENHICDDDDNMIFSSFIKSNKMPNNTVKLQTYLNKDDHSLIKEITAHELKDTYIYDEASDLLIKQINGNGGKTEYEYDSNMNLIRMTAAVSNLTNSLMMSNEYYYDNDRISAISHNGFQYSFDYSAFGDIKATYIGDMVYATYDYEAGYGSIWSKTTYSNGQSISAIYDDKNNLTGISYDDGLTMAYENIFDKNGTLLKTIDNQTKTIITYTNQGMIVSNNDEAIYSVEYVDTNKINYTIDDQSYTYHYHELNDDMNKQILYSSETKTGNSSVKTNYITDQRNNVLYRGAKTSNGISAETHYSYKTDGEQSPLVYSQDFILENRNNKYNTTFTYSYDKMGNITAINRNGIITNKYTYDEIGQLIREDDLLTSQSIVYIYDKGGNIVNKEVCQYGEQFSKTNSISYKYEDDNWRDKLTSINGNSITYDEIGNPLSYKENVYHWIEGRTLHSVDSKDGKRIEYMYDSNGLRIQKNIYTKTSQQSFKYYWNGNVLTMMKIETETAVGKTASNTVAFIYETSATNDDWQTPVGFIVDGNQYYLYEKNLSGDVIAIYNDNTQVATYQYDAYGNIIHSEIQADYNESFNPFYYRSYQYDFDSNMYYLYSRYYVPEWGRFLNSDIYLDTGTGLIGTNMFAYADNNPVNSVDPFGYWAKNDHKNWTNNFLSSAVKGSYITQIADNNLETDNKFPAPIAMYQHIHFDRTDGSDDSRATYAAQQISNAVNLCASEDYSSAMVELGYGMHAIQDVTAHGQIGTEWLLADHVVRPRLSSDSTIKTWIYADDVTYKWEDSNTMRKLIADSGVTSSNYTTTSARYGETALTSALMIISFKMTLPSNLRSVFFY